MVIVITGFGTRATSLVRVKIMFMTHVVWDIGTKKMKKQKHQISLTFVNFSLA